jgi:hypothetical protein
MIPGEWSRRTKTGGPVHQQDDCCVGSALFAKGGRYSAERGSHAGGTVLGHDGGQLLAVIPSVRRDKFPGIRGRGTQHDGRVLPAAFEQGPDPIVE